MGGRGGISGGQARLWALAWALTWSLARTAAAQAGGLPSQDPAGFVGFASTRAPGPGLLDGSVALVYALDPLRLPASSPGGGGQVRHQLAVNLARVRVGLGGRGALRVSLPAWAVSEGAGTQPGAADGEAALQVRVWGAPTDDHGDTPEGAGAQLELATSVPLGWAQTLQTERKPRLSGALTADMHAFGVVAGARASFAHHLSAPASGLGRDRLALSLGAQVPALLLGRRFPEQLVEHVLLELALESEPQHLFARGHTAVEGRGALRFRAGDWLLTGGLSAGLLRTRETPTLQVFLAVGNSPRPRDADRDGVLDRDDRCPELTEDVDGYQDADGCPEPDNDGDGILDEDDRCPLSASDWDRDADEDGCNDR